tara:strand:+ start:605 stop:1669 length:1065 start_codon:yes stop_codon:yes gene_type:complete
MIDSFFNIVNLNFFLILLINLLLFFFLNTLFFKKNILIDQKKTSSHKQLINKDAVPLSGGIILLINCIFFDIFNSWQNQILISTIFLVGLFADLQKLNSPLKRLVIQTLTIIIFVSINEMFIRSIRISLIDTYLNHNLISIIFTSFCLLILINGSNFIDGSNLQCSGYYLAVLIIFYYLNSNNLLINNFEIVNILFPFLLSFMLLNFLNKSYFGDGGSYLLSFVLGCILIKYQNVTNISPYFIALVLWYPAYENFFSLIRKARTKNIKPDEPDLLHFHHLLFKYINNKFSFSKNLSSSIPSIIINFFNFIIFFIGTQFIYSTFELIILIFICVSVYTLFYFILLRRTKSKLVDI